MRVLPIETRLLHRAPRPTVVVHIWRDESLQRAILESAREFGWDLLALDLTNNVLPVDPAPAGAILDTAVPRSLIRRLRAASVHVVRVGVDPHPAKWQVPAVLEDMTTAGRLAAEHFAGRGFRQLAYVARKPWAERRLLCEGFRQRADELKLACSVLRFESTNEPMASLYRWRARQFSAWLRDLPRPVGLFTFSDRQAGQLGAMARAAGLAVPEDVAILGYGNYIFDCEAALRPISPWLASIDDSVTGAASQSKM